MTDTAATRLHAKLTRELGPVVTGALGDAEVIEIALNADGGLWEDRLGAGMRRIGAMESTRAEMAMATIASALGKTVSRANPVLEGELPLDGSRFEGVLPPVSAAPVFAIRKRASRGFSLDEYLQAGAIDADMRAALREAVRTRRNILVAGGAGSGKTTFTNALIDEIVAETPEHRIALIEDTTELNCAARNAVALRTSDTVTMTGLLRASLRLRPDRILVGEVRGPEALALLKAWNTGHPGGVATLHADSAPRALTRLEQLVLEAVAAPMQTLISESVDIVLFLERTPTGRRVGEALRVDGFDQRAGRFQLRPLVDDPRPPPG